MVTLDDRLLGEKLQNYCSSSEDEGDDDKGKKMKNSTIISVLVFLLAFRQRF